MENSGTGVNKTWNFIIYFYFFNLVTEELSMDSAVSWEMGKEGSGFQDSGAPEALFSDLLKFSTR